MKTFVAKSQLPHTYQHLQHKGLKKNTPQQSSYPQVAFHLQMTLKPAFFFFLTLIRKPLAKQEDDK